MTTEYETIVVERQGRTVLLALNRPKAPNALNLQVVNEVVAAPRRSTGTRTVAALS